MCGVPRTATFVCASREMVFSEFHGEVFFLNSLLAVVLLVLLPAVLVRVGVLR